MEADETKRAGRPPYAPLKGVREFFDRVTAKEPPALVDRKYLQHLGVAAGNEQHLVVALRALRLIDDEGCPTRAFDVLYLQGPDRKRGLQNLLRLTYPGLFSGEIDLSKASRGEVHDHFVREHKMHGQMARKAAGFFTLLATLAGIPLSPDLSRENRQIVADRRVRVRSRTTLGDAPIDGGSDRQLALGSQAGRGTSFFVGGPPPVCLVLKPEMTEEEMLAAVRRFRRALQQADGDADHA